MKAQVKFAVCQFLFCLAGAALAPSLIVAQSGRIVTDTVRSPSLANLLGSPAETRVTVYLPPSYDSAPGSRYPVVYMLHGFGSSDLQWIRPRPFGYDIQKLMDSLVAANLAKEMILVMPNASTKFLGSFYVNSFAMGQWEDFIAHDLVAWTDSKFRTIAKPESRGIAGHSMGGYGTFYLGMRHGGTLYGAMYALSGCCTHMDSDKPEGAAWAILDTISTFAALARTGFTPRVLAALSAAFAPDSAKPPFFFDVVANTKGDTLTAVPAVLAKWNAHSPFLMLPQDRANLLRMRGIQFDVGLQDERVAPSELMAMDSAMTRAGIPHTFETYEGTHTSRIGIRLVTRVLPFFSRTLVFEPAAK